ncbi:MAG: DUF3619 family protein [Betaproteobacteria bacterium]|nr:DUF3619 family protein [Betaproteobacteria bacterium]NBY72134.1 DUF3619 family protein [Betaproteobacteria bacterium]NDD13023.1 DUF3619 family protein [Betaproteobacteria bacterium]
MNNTTKLQASDQFGLRLAARLNDAAQDLPRDIAERLRAGRVRALDLYPTNTQLATSFTSKIGQATLQLGGFSHHTFWPKLVSFIPLLALLAGLVLMDNFSDNFLAQDLAEIDSAILADELPPAAYTDPGFAQFLKNRLDVTAPTN